MQLFIVPPGNLPFLFPGMALPTVKTDDGDPYADPVFLP